MNKTIWEYIDLKIIFKDEIKFIIEIINNTKKYDNSFENKKYFIIKKVSHKLSKYVILHKNKNFINFFVLLIIYQIIVLILYLLKLCTLIVLNLKVIYFLFLFFLIFLL